MNQKKKPSYTDECKAEAVALASQQGGHIPRMVRNLEISESAFGVKLLKKRIHA